MDASQRYTFYRRKHRPGVPKKLQSDLAERSRRSVPNSKYKSCHHCYRHRTEGWEQARWLEGLIVQIGQWITWKSWIANKGINFLTEAHSEQIPNGQNIQRSVTAARRIEMHCDFLNSFSDETVGRFLKKYCRWDEDQVQHQKEKLKTSRCRGQTGIFRMQLVVSQRRWKIMTERTPKGHLS